MITPDIGVTTPKWIWLLKSGAYVPLHEWDVLLTGYQNWHKTGASFPAGKGQSPDYKNWGVTLPSVALSLRRFDEANTGSVVERDAETYWSAIILASAAVMARMRAARAVTEAKTAVEFQLPDATKLVKRAQRSLNVARRLKCPRFYANKLPPLATF